MAVTTHKHEIERNLIADALSGHRLNTMSQDSGNHCVCGSDSRFAQRNGDLPWRSIDEHRADMVLRAFSTPGEPPGKHV